MSSLPQSGSPCVKVAQSERIDGSRRAYYSLKAKHLFIGGATTGHANETLLSGLNKYKTAVVVGKYLG